MRWSALLLVPLFVVACDREPVAPDLTPTLDLQPSMSTGAVTPGVQPRNAKPLGRTYEEWGVALFRWLAEQPTSSTPFLDETGAFAQATNSGKVWFLAGPSQYLSQPQTGAITMPVGTWLVLAPLAAYMYGPGEIAGNGDDTPAEVLAFNTWLLDLIADVEVSIDGVPVSDIAQYRVLTPIVSVQVPEHCIDADLLGSPGPFTFGGLGGYVIVLNPLPPGVHTIHALSAVPDFGLAFDMTYTITVQPGR